LVPPRPRVTSTAAPRPTASGAVPGGAKNPVVVMARCRHGNDHAHPRRLGLWLRRPALPGCICCHHGRDARPSFTEQIVATATIVKWDTAPLPASRWAVISAESKARIEGLIAKGEHDGARVLVDGAAARFQVTKTATSFCLPCSTTFHPCGDGAHGNLRAGAQPYARRLDRRSYRPGQRPQLRQHGVHLHLRRRQRAPLPLRSECSNVGINVGVAAPMSTFPFSGWGESFFATCTPRRITRRVLHPNQGGVERWPREWSRKF